MSIGDIPLTPCIKLLSDTYLLHVFSTPPARAILRSTIAHSQPICLTIEAGLLIPQPLCYRDEEEEIWWEMLLIFAISWSVLI